MKKVFATFQISVAVLLLFLSSNLPAQNLIPNYGFEIQDSCPEVSEIFVAPPWNSPTLGTPDLFNSSCPTQSSDARTGIGSAGILVYSIYQEREYIQAPLISPLIAGQTYRVSFWVKRSDLRYATNRMGAYFSTSKITDNNSTTVLPYSPQIDNPTNNLLFLNAWMEVSDSFIATGGESYIIIGSFASNAQTDTVVVNSGTNVKLAYYSIDDISVTASITGIGDETLMNDIHVFPTPAKDFLNIRVPPSLTVQTIRLINVCGQEIQSMNVSQSGRGDFVLRVDDVPAGIYTLLLQLKEGTASQKVLVVK